uniref:Similar to Os07g0681600 n=1 Tax=Arundo donax TaxID=35708 RepID=A0A0A9CXB1_ARUDO
MRGICQKNRSCCCLASNLVEDAGALICLLMFSVDHGPRRLLRTIMINFKCMDGVKTIHQTGGKPLVVFL